MSSPRKLKILMLHGYTQSGPIFHAKTRALEKILDKSFPAVESCTATKPTPGIASYPGGIELLYPTAPIRLRASDIPGFSSVSSEEAEESDAWAWWVREVGTGWYTGIEDGLRTIAETIRNAGGIDAVIGFSQGAAAAAFVASLLEPGREAAFKAVRERDPTALVYPEDWKDLQKMHPQGLRLAVSYSGFYAPHQGYQAFYEPPIRTPMLHFIGSLDSVVDEYRTRGLAERCVASKKRVVVHPGGHFVPVGKEMAGVLVAFIKSSSVEEEIVEG